MMIFISTHRPCAKVYHARPLTYLCRFLSSSGIDSVKCDDQMSIDEFDQGSDRVQLGLAYQDAMKKCSSRYFSRRVIYCEINAGQLKKC